MKSITEAMAEKSTEMLEIYGPPIEYISLLEDIIKRQDAALGQIRAHSGFTSNAETYVKEAQAEVRKMLSVGEDEK